MNGEVTGAVDAKFADVHLYPQYQPIVSIAKGRTMGFEGLIRGIAVDGSASQPAELFSLARKKNLTLELDRQCREIILNDYASNEEACRTYSLFINIDTSILERAEGSGYLYDQVTRCGMSPETVVIEICESKANDTEKLLRFVSRYKSHGFLIALDDLGTGFSNLERIPILRPDIVKLDRSLVRNIENDAYKRECLKSLVRLANSIGAIAVAEGVETETEAYAALESGAHLLQGFYFSRPEFLAQENLDRVDERIRGVSAGFKKYMKRKIMRDKARKRRHEAAIGALLDGLRHGGISRCDSVLHGFGNAADAGPIECVYVLNEQGRQVSDTVFISGGQDDRKKLLFCPATVGTDHSLKEYYYRLANSRLSKYYSEPYISMATGNVCVTLTISFRDDDSNAGILCIDYRY